MIQVQGHAELAAGKGLDVYLYEPHSPWQRPTNENTNGLLRQWFGRSADFYALDSAHIEQVATSLNNRPRRTLDWRTPADLFAAAAALTATHPEVPICAASSAAKAHVARRGLSPPAHMCRSTRSIAQKRYAPRSRDLSGGRRLTR